MVAVRAAVSSQLSIAELPRQLVAVQHGAIRHLAVACWCQTPCPSHRFHFTSPYPGVFHEAWQMHTHPPLAACLSRRSKQGDPIAVMMRGVAVAGPDGAARLQVQQEQLEARLTVQDRDVQVRLVLQSTLDGAVPLRQCC